MVELVHLCVHVAKDPDDLDLGPSACLPTLTSCPNFSYYPVGLVSLHFSFPEKGKKCQNCKGIFFFFFS
jgi:hypothetical protein